MAERKGNRKRSKESPSPEDGERREGPRSDKTSTEPLPILSKEGGVEPLVVTPSRYHDRTRDRELDEEEEG